jgi:flagellar biosynthesis protein FlhF
LHLKRFKGRHLPEVMRQVREEFGPDAVILQTRQNAGKGVLRFLGGAAVEVLAAVDRAPRPDDRRSGDTAGGRAAFVPVRPAPAGPSRAAAAAPDADRGRPADRSREDVAQLRHLLIRFGGARMLPPPATMLYERLLARGLDDTLAFDLVDDLGGGDPGVSDDALAALVEDRLAGLVRTADAPLGPRAATVAVVGPTGSGKTTTLAKLAARSRVAGGTTQVLDLDVTALGTGSRLAAIAGILGVAYTLATTADDLARALDQPTLRGLTLIDTPGLSPRDDEGLAALATLLGRARPSEVHLVLSATTKTDDARAAVAAFGLVGATHLVFTRLDETASLGSVIGVAASCDLPLSYLGTGPEIPDGIRPASARALARRVLGEGERPS